MIIIECQCNPQGTDGVCNKENGECTCKDGYFGIYCEQGNFKTFNSNISVNHFLTVFL